MPCWQITPRHDEGNDFTGQRMNGTSARFLLLALNLLWIREAVSADVDPWEAISFLQGTWGAEIRGGVAGAQGNSAYSFNAELRHHVISRTSAAPMLCKGPEEFDCGHSDLLFIYQEGANQPLKAIYFDNEGHVIHYQVSTPQPATAVFTSDAIAPGPQYRLMYQLSGAIMSGKFQMRMPGQQEWKSYLEWSGTKQ
jgi:hypothetical protein